jgi:hypothetical protein
MTLASDGDERSLAPAAVDRNSPFYVSSFLHRLAGWAHRHHEFLLGLGRLESRVLSHALGAIRIRMPVYVCGLARSGSTLLHHVLAAHPGVATHRVKDYPLVCTPYWWRQATRRFPPAAPRERAHGDRVQITPDSPEALEEMVWAAFFPHCHDPSVSNLLGAETSHPRFEAFYRDHIRKLLLAEQAERYAAKANYHVARLLYLHRLFPDARFLIPVREPASQIASLMRQHERFSAGERRHPRALAYMQWSGHFEFGLDRRPIHLGDGPQVRAVLEAWDRGEEVRGWARYWALVHEYLHRVLDAEPGLRSAALVVRYEEMCDRPADVLMAVLEHCRMPEAKKLISTFTPQISPPDYYSRSLTAQDLAVIHEETAAAARSWGYI